MNIARLIKLAAALDYRGCHVSFFEPSSATPDSRWCVDVAQPGQFGGTPAIHRCYGATPEEAAAKAETELVAALKKHMASAEATARRHQASLEALLKESEPTAKDPYDQ